MFSIDYFWITVKNHSFVKLNKNCRFIHNFYQIFVFDTQSLFVFQLQIQVLCFCDRPLMSQGDKLARLTTDKANKNQG